MEKKMGMLIKNIYINGLMATTVLMTKVTEGENKTPDVSGLVTNTVLITKMEKLEIRYLIKRNTSLLLKF